jgi:hypothetical protein
MHTVIRRYEGIDSSRMEEIIGAVNDDFIPRLTETEGVIAYYVVDAGGGALATISICDTAEEAEGSTQLAATFIRDHGLADALPNPPQVTSGEVVAQRTGIATRS